MKKEDFIMETENWLVRQDVSDFVCKASTARKKNIVDYLEQTESILKWKAPDLLDDFHERVKNAHLRGAADFIKKKRY